MRITFTFLLSVVIALAACSDKKEESAQTGTKTPIVCVSNYPLKYFVERIAVSEVEVHFPIPEEDDPAFWKPKPEDVSLMQKADLIILNGASYESWLENVSLSQAKLVDTSADFRERLIPCKTDRP